MLWLSDNFCQLGIKGGDYESLLFKPCKDRYGGGVYFGFQVTGMMGGFCGFESFDSGIFWGVGEFGKYFFWVAWFVVGIFSGIQNNLKIRDSNHGIYHGSEASLRINTNKLARKFGMAFFGLVFGPDTFLGFVGSLGVFLGFEFAPIRSLIPVIWNPEYPLGTDNEEKISFQSVNHMTNGRIETVGPWKWGQLPQVPGGTSLIMAYTGRLRPKGVPFPGFKYMEG